MSKLVYPEEGLNPRCKSISDAIDDSLMQAISRCSFDVPSSGGFGYAGYLRGLSGTLRGHMNTNKNIANKIKQTDNSYEGLSSSLTSKAGSIAIYKLAKRKRMIL